MLFERPKMSWAKINLDHLGVVVAYNTVVSGSQIKGFNSVSELNQNEKPYLKDWNNSLPKFC